MVIPLHVREVEPIANYGDVQGDMCVDGVECESVAICRSLFERKEPQSKTIRDCVQHHVAVCEETL